MSKAEMVEMLHVILETMCVLISRMFFSNSIEHVFFFEIVILKVKPTAIRIFHRPLNANDFSNTFLNDFQQIDNKTNEIHFLGDCNINLPQNGKFILKENSHMNLKIPFLPQ